LIAGRERRNNRNAQNYNRQHMSLLSGRWTLGYNHSSYLSTFRKAASLDVAGRHCRIRPERTSLLKAYALVETNCLFLADTRFQAQDELASASP
jgi:hypothetical protein